MKHGLIGDRVTAHRRHMKRKGEGRSVLLHPKAKDARAEWIACLQERAPKSGSTPVILSRKGSGRAIGRKQAWRILTTSHAVSNLPGTLGTHTMRRALANEVQVLLGPDLVKIQRALGPRNVNSTVADLSFMAEEIDEAIPALRSQSGDDRRSLRKPISTPPPSGPGSASGGLVVGMLRALAPR